MKAATARAILLAASATTFLLPASVAGAEKPASPRQVVVLDGVWQVEQGGMEAAPKSFGHTVPVPGLLDMATPSFEEVGKKSRLRQAFWYRRVFAVEGKVPPVAMLKVHKARYGTKVFLNGHVVGEHLPCFTPAYVDVKEHLKGDGQENELVIRVGADRECLPDGMPTGWDFEKYLYLPGVYDSVELILTGEPYIRNVQVVPQIEQRQVRVVAELQPDGVGGLPVSAEVVEVGTGRAASSPVRGAVAAHERPERKLDLTIPIDNCRLWSPEDPFLYELRLSTAGDAVKVRFGMRSFRFDPKTKRAVLNGKPYFLRGSNVCIYRFFEDAERGDRPWRAEWVRRLHRQFKTMNWNALRYCIGFPPERWYDIADEEGFLIQDEFPIWLLGKAPEDPKADKIIPEYTEWMRERWNHPCVVIWDAQNESFTAETGKAISAVRHLDLSNRPWENGWAEPQSPTDCVEAHPYLFIRAWTGKGSFRMSEMEKVSGVPPLQKPQQKLDVPIVINEYAWLWLNRDGTPTCLTDKVYESLLGPNSTTEQRRLLYARYLAAKTEFWRAHRQCAGVLHFCGLGYSRPSLKPRPEGGATSDHFIDLERLTFEPHFAQYVREAFHPLGLMLNFWAEQLAPGATRRFEVFVINDRYEPWKGEVTLKFLQAGKEFAARSEPCEVAGLGRQILTVAATVPSEPGDYTIVARLRDGDQTIRSLRDVKVK